MIESKQKKKLIQLGLLFLSVCLFLLSFNSVAKADDSTPASDTTDLTVQTLESTFSQITYTFNAKSFTPKDYPAELDLENGLNAQIQFQTKEKSISLSSGHAPLKQTIILTNPTDTDQTENITVRQQIKNSTGAFTWDGKDYQANETPQTFQAYMGETEVNLNDKTYADQLKGEHLPKIKNIKTLKGTQLTFPTKDGKVAVYDFSDLARLNPEITVQKDQNNHIILTLTLKNIEVKANRQTILDPTYDLADSSNYNLRFGGKDAGVWDDSDPNDPDWADGSWLGFGGVVVADFNGNGKPDILVGAPSESNNSRAGSGSLYVIYDSLLDDYSGVGNDLDLANPANYNLRYDGAAAGDNLTNEGALVVADINGNGKQDILVGANGADNNSHADSGSLYVIYDSLLDDYSGTGHNIDLATPANYNLRYDGAVAEDYLSDAAVAVADMNGNDKLDILVGAESTDNNSRSASGSLYVIYDSLLDDYSGTGHNIDLANPANYNLRYDGAVADDNLSYSLLQPTDVNGNGKPDLLIGSGGADNNSRDSSGSLYIIYDSLVDDYSGTGNSIDLATPTNYNLRYDGAFAHAWLGENGNVADLDGNGKADLLLADETGPNDYGALYVIKDSLLDDYAGTGHNIDLANSENYNLRYDGVSGDLAYGDLVVADFNGNGRKDIIVGEPWATATQGYLYVIYDSLIDDYSGTGDNIALSDPANYSIRYDGDGEFSFMYAEASSYQFAVDINGDGQIDLTPWNGWSTFAGRHNAGSLYILYNFPHTITFDSVPALQKSNSFTVTGNIDASENSLTDIAGVEYAIDSHDPTGTWTPCSATDGTFDSLTENFSCNLTDLSEGSHTVYLRAYDTNISYTAESHYATTTFLVNTTPTHEIASPTPEKLTEAITQGFITIPGDNPTSTESFTFTTDTNLTTSNAQITFPANTTATKTDGGNLDLTQLTLQTLSTSIFKDARGAISLGIPNLNLTFSQPITISIPVSKDYNNKTLKVYFQRNGETNWNQETTCQVENKLCTFTTTHATTYVASYTPPQKAKLDSFSYKIITDLTDCPQKLELTLNGHHLKKNSVVKIGNEEADSLKYYSSQKLKARFCLQKLQNIQTDPSRTVSVQNPNTDNTKATKKLNLSLIPDTTKLNPYTIEGIQNIQKILVQEKLLITKGITGINDQATTEAVKAFQAKYNIPVTGFVGSLTIAKLGEE